ncbi:MAG TPA: PHB depolymerase family esterase [Methylocella sp.]|nr:PHB depolymerase family esterase [Methylocella sp.]
MFDLLELSGFPALEPAVAWPARQRKAPPVPIGKGAFYLSGTFSCKSGTRSYKAYIPGHAAGRNAPLLVMLHGCAQDPDDFAIGTGMNLLAEEYGFIVAYPGQSASANQKGCWNWFYAANQMRGRGEPEIIAGITLSVLETFGADPGRVFVAGLSAGGAMAAVMGAAYPELYAAVGIHSGLAYGSAKDLASAYAAMRGAPGLTQVNPPRKRAPGNIRTIVFHGTSDRAVHPSNGGRIFSEARAALTGAIREKRHTGRLRGRSYACTVIEDYDGVPLVEYWAVEGLGHAWSGGQAEGTHTDPRGPDASREFVRFFLAGKAQPPRLRRAAG